MLADTFGTFGNTICCDDIRQEMNGKFIIAGIYTRDILVTDIPTVLGLRLFVEYTCPEIGTQQLDFVWSMNANELAVLEGTVSQETLSSPVIIALPSAALEIHSEGTLIVSARLANGATKEILRREVSRAAAPIPII